MKSTITQEDYNNVTKQAFAAREILEDERFEFIREWFRLAKNYVEKSILENTVTDVEETVTISESIKKTFFTPKKVQIDELSGQYKLIKKFFEDMEYFANLKKDLDEEISRKKVIIDESKV